MASIEVSDRMKKRIDGYIAADKAVDIEGLLEQAFDDMDANNTFWEESDARIIKLLAGEEA